MIMVVILMVITSIKFITSLYNKTYHQKKNTYRYIKNKKKKKKTLKKRETNDGRVGKVLKLSQKNINALKKKKNIEQTRNN